MPSKGKKNTLSQVVAENGCVVEVGSDIQVYAGQHEPPYVAHVFELRPSKQDNAKLKVEWYYYPEDVPRGRQPYHGRLEVFRSNHTDDISSKSVMKLCTVLSLEQWVDHIVSKDPSRPDYRGPVAPDARISEGDSTIFNAKQVDGTGGSDAGPSGQYGDPGASTSKRAAEEAQNDTDARSSKKARTDANTGGDENDATANNAGEDEEGSEDEEEEEEDDSSVAPTYMCRHEYDAHRQTFKDVEVSVYCICNQPYNPDLDMVQCMNCAEWYHPDCINMQASTLKAIGEGKSWRCGTCGEEGLVDAPGWSQAHPAGIDNELK